MDDAEYEITDINNKNTQN